MKLFKATLVGILVVIGIIVFQIQGILSKVVVTNDTFITIKSGQSVKQILATLQDNINFNSRLIYLYIRTLGQGSEFKAGEYLVSKKHTMAKLLQDMKTGNVAQHPFTLIEGQTLQQLIQAIQQEIRIVKDPLKVDKSYEGKLLAETYYFTTNTKASDLVKRMLKAGEVFLNDAWSKKSSNCTLNTSYEALILASIIEKETSIKAEMPQVAGVYINRLNKGMLLQADPTVVYGLGDKFSGRILKSNLKTDTPYNTYTRRGLPPTPIATPSKAAITAAVNPMVTDKLYFVADGKGGHVFSKTLEQHLEAVKKYRASVNG